MSWHNAPGFGDQSTWGPCTGHPGDPRTDDTGIHERLDAGWKNPTLFGESFAERLANRLDFEHLARLIGQERAGADRAVIEAKIAACVLGCSDAIEHEMRSDYLLPNGSSAHAHLEEDAA